MRGALLLLCTAGVLGVTACGGSKSGAEHAVTGFDPSKGHIVVSFRDLDTAALSDASGLRRAALKHLRDSAAGPHYAAVYGLALTATPKEGTTELVAMLTSESVDERLLSAASLVGSGDKRGLPVLVDALDQHEKLSFRDPSEPAFAFARAVLLNLTAGNFGLRAAVDRPAAVAATKPAWLRWWNANKATVHFESRTKRFVA
jgi:hypothetical protein